MKYSTAQTALSLRDKVEISPWNEIKHLVINLPETPEKNYSHHPITISE